MNRNYKVIWNRSLGCFTAVAEYAKSRGKSSKSSVSSNSTINTTSNLSSTSVLRLSAMGIGLVVAGFSIQANAAPCVGSMSVECGTNAAANPHHAIAIGKNAQAEGGQSIAIGGASDGQITKAVGEQSIAIGANVVSKGVSSIAIGGDDLDAASKINTNGDPASNTLNGGTVNTTFKYYTGRDMVEPGNFNVYTESSGAASIAIGIKSLSKGALSTAVGVHSSSSGTASSAFGMGSSASGTSSVALGAGSKAQANEGVALGSMSVANRAATGTGAVFIPTSADNSVAINLTRSSTLGAVSVGGGEKGTRQIINVAAGSANSDAVNVAQLQGVDSKVNKGLNFTGDNTTTTINRKVGEKLTIKGGATDLAALTTGNIGVVAGGNTLSIKLAKDLTDLDTITINNGGPIIRSSGINMGAFVGKPLNKITNLKAGVSDYDAVNVGQLKASTTRYYSVNDNGTAKANYTNNGATGVDSMAAGIAATAGGTFSTAVGTEANAQGYASTALGLKAQATGVNSTALGREANATGDYSSALGWEASASADNSMALGRKAEATGANNIALGREANTAGRNSTALGLKASASANNSMALGTEAKATAAKSIALGEGANATHEGSFALGSGSLADGATLATAAFQPLDNNGNLITVAAPTAKSEISVGNAGMERRIINVAAGATDTDAVNVSQLKLGLAGAKTHFYSVNSTDSTRGNYNNDGATGTDAMAAGIEASATGVLATAMGTGANAKGDKATAIGADAEASGIQASAFSVGAKAIGRSSVASGWEAQALGGESIALGVRSYAEELGATGVGPTARARGENSVALGRRSKADGVGAMALGGFSEASANGAIALGEKAKASGENAIAIGKGSLATGSQAIGVNSRAGNGGAAFGDNADAGGSTMSFTNTVIKGTALGNAAIVNVDDGIALGSKSVASVAGGAIGFFTAGATTANQTAIANTNSVALGAVSVGTGAAGGNRQIVNVAAGTMDSDAVNVAQLKGLSNTVAANKIKYYSVNSSGGTNDLNEGATGQNAMAMGRNAVATGGQAISIGSSAGGQKTTASGQQSIAIGANAVSKGASSIAIGGDDLDAASKANIDGTSVSGINGGNVNATFKAYTGRDLVETPPYLVNTASDGAASIAMGAKALSTGALSTAIGVQSSSAGTASSAFGVGSSASQDGSVALGAGSTTATNATSETTMTVGGKVYNVAGQAVNAGDQVSVGSAGAERQMKNVAAGNVSATSTDAINGSQLFATNDSINTLSERKITFASDTGTPVDRKLGDTLNIKGGATNLSDNNIGVVSDGSDTLTVKLAKDLTGLNSAAFGSDVKISSTGLRAGNTIVNQNGISFTSTGSVNDGVRLTSAGLHNGNKQITGVLSGGANLTNAANIGDVQTIAGGLKTIVAGGTNITGITKSTTNGQDTYTVNADGASTSAGSGAVIVTPGTKDANNVTDYAVDLSADSKASLGKADSAMQSVVTQIDGVAVKTINQADNKANFVTGSNIVLSDDGLGGIEVALAERINLGTNGSIRTGNTSVSNRGFVIAGSTLANTVVLNSNGLNNGGNKITNVDDGVADDDAVNVSQLNNSTNDLVDLGLNFTGDDTTTVVNRKLGKTLTIKGGATADLTNNNIGVVADTDGNLNVKLAKDINLGATGSMQIGSSLVNRDGFTFASEGGPDKTVILSSSGLNNGGNVITNVGDGEADSDAVNVGQLNAVKQSAADANKGWNVSAQGANVSTVKPSDTVDLNNTDGNINVSKTADSNNVTFNLSKDIVVDSVKTGDATLNNDGLTIAGGPKFTKTGIDAADNKITNVANGTVAFESKDAVNGGQLQEVITGIKADAETFALEMNAGLNFDADSGPVINKKMGASALSFKGSNNITTTAEGSSIKFDLNGNISVDSVTTGNTSMSSNGVTITGGPSMTLDNGINAGGKVIKDVADGMAPRDAVNFGQLDAVSRNLGNSINELGYKIGEVEDDANAGISAAMAMSSLPQANIAGRSMIGGGIASYNGESAAAIGISRVSDNGRWVMKINGTADTQGNAGGAIGAGFHF